LANFFDIAVMTSGGGFAGIGGVLTAASCVNWFGIQYPYAIPYERPPSFNTTNSTANRDS